MIWDTIPSDTDILVTHGPPLGMFVMVYFIYYIYKNYIYIKSMYTKSICIKSIYIKSIYIRKYIYKLYIYNIYKVYISMVERKFGKCPLLSIHKTVSVGNKR